MKGIAIAGSILVDKINEISAYPTAGELTKIMRTSLAVGGCVPNVAVDLKRMDDRLEVRAIGRIGADEEGAYVVKTLEANGVNCEGIKKVEDKTSFTDVMSVVGGERTFFTYAGANAEFGVGDFDFDNFPVKMLHLGYFLLLDKVDNGDGLQILKLAQEKGIKTSIDLVSENSDRYTLLLPCLAYVDNVIINEVEAGKIAGIEPKNENMRAIAEKIKSYGVKERVIIHAPKFGVCLSNDGFTVVPSYQLPDGFIKGTTGAGDAFCAACLRGIYNEDTDEEILSFASAAAVSALSEADAVSGVKRAEEIQRFCQQFERRKICL